MRVIIALLLVFGGGLCALAVAWFFFNSSPTQAPVVTDVRTMDTLPENGGEPAVKATSADSQANSGTPDNGSLESNPSDKLIFEMARIGPDGSAVFAGRAPAGAEIRLYLGDNIISQTTANQDGEWVALPDHPLQPGKHMVIAEMTTNQNQLIRAERAVVIELSGEDDQKPLVALVPMSDDAQAEILSVPEKLAAEEASKAQDNQQSVSSSGSMTAQIPLIESQVETADISVSTLSWKEDGRLHIKGSAVGGASVSGNFGNQPLESITFSDKGKWSGFASPEAGQQNMVSVQVFLFNKAGDTIAQTQMNVDIRQLDIGLDGSEMVVISKGDVLWRIAYRTYGNGVRYLDIVKRNAGRIDNPDLIYPTQIFALPDAE